MTIKNYSADYRKKNREKLLRQAREWKHRNPEKVREGKRRWEKENRDKVRLYNLRYKKKKNPNYGLGRIKVKRFVSPRMEVLMHYSNGEIRCACCGESELKFLAIDHVVKIGKKERVKQKSFSGSSMYYWLINNKFPVGYQVLCHNCNCAKGFYGECPHLSNIKK